jgi:UDP-N-acetylglucosamine diphosphorylase / glucose-1-phosphate thymidylyltransferase / UDP-N-acetylgalactosamine diphosphorylase / glucosamine-1-phosphate N-acetyltransferase / galactosamine-1-phosphate N-acetyltransferase
VEKIKDLSIEAFFSLSDFAHAKLFSECFYPWEVLHLLENYLNAQELGKIEVEVPSTVHLINPSTISIGKGTLIEPGAYIEGPCIIGPDCTIRHGAYIRGHLITGKGCVIGHDTEVKHSIFLDGVCAAHFNYVGDCILGNGVNLGAGVKCANLRLDHGLISIHFEGEKRPTNLKKLGVIAGDGVQMGCNAVTNPGTLLGKETFCYPCLNIGGYIPPKTTIRVQK